jgi:hypothetical protein
MKKVIFYALCLALIISCRSDNQIKQLLIGSWQGSSWTVGGKDVGRNAKSVAFDFKADDTYTASFEGQGEEGVYRVVDNKLYTTANAANKIEKMVKIAVITADSFVMDMNRMGDAEQLIMIKQR